MLTRSKLYSKREPTKEAKLFIIFCEGEKTEPNYFKYFNGISSQIKIIIVPHSDGKNSPEGLFNSACQHLLKSETNFTKYDLSDQDEVWFVVDTDTWGEKITTMRSNCAVHNWQIAQSNPCFEVWLYYHFKSERADFQDIEISQNWKKHLNDIIGGFNTNKHPIYIQTAIENSKKNFYIGINNQPDVTSTEVFHLAEKLLPLIKSDIDTALSML